MFVGLARCAKKIMSARIGFIAAVCAFGVTAPSHARAQPAADEPDLERGAFSAEQAERGRQGFSGECVECHEIEEFTGSGAYFDEQVGETLWSVFEYIWAEMPEDKPAWLDPEQYAEILAYLLAAYGFPAGQSDLPIDQESLERLRVKMPARAGG